jgi:DNA-binding transcriptional regulator YiaG
MEPNDRIREARKKILGLSQGEFARVLGLDQATVSRWERSLSQPRPHHLRAIALLADRPVSWFYEEDAA